MNEDVKLSVLITYYNQKEYVKDSLESVLNQRVNFPYEILIGDDGSEDGTYELLLDYQSKHANISVFRMPRDIAPGEKAEPITRVSRNRYNLYMKAKGEFVAFLDGDDYFIDPDKLQMQIDLLEENPKLAACGGPILLKYEDGTKDAVSGDRFDKRVIMSAKQYWVNLWFHADTFVFRNNIDKSRLSKCAFDDNMITCSFLKYGDVLYDPKPTVAYRQLEGSSWDRRNEADRLLINLLQYSEGLRLLHWPIICFFRSYFDLKALYKMRKSGIQIELDRDLAEVITRSRFIKRTINYLNMSGLGRALYELCYYPVFKLDDHIIKKKDKYIGQIRQRMVNE